MKTSVLQLVTLVVSLHGVLSATIPVDEENLIEHGEEAIEGLSPPKPTAHDHYPQGRTIPESPTPYVVEITRRFLKFQTTGFPAQHIPLTQRETEGIQNLSLSIVELLKDSKLSSETSENEPTPDWKDVNPVITLSNSGITLRFTKDPEDEPDSSETTTEDKQILWDFLTKYARNIFSEKLKEFNLSEKYNSELETSTEPQQDAFLKFTYSLWRIMKLSVDYAESNYDGWTTPETTEDKKVTSATIFAYEEPSPFHILPSQESEYRRKDIDSLFYGRGII